MPDRVFISYKTTDKKYVNDVNSMSLNPNNKIEFIDCSLPEPITNHYGHIIRRHPDDEGSQPVKDEIFPLLRNSDKLLVIIGKDTHSSGWVKWEVRTFIQIHGAGAKILLMRHKDNLSAGMPKDIGDIGIHNWDQAYLREFLES